MQIATETLQAPLWKQRSSSSSDKQSDGKECVCFSPPLKQILHLHPIHLKTNLQGDIRLLTLLFEVRMRTSPAGERQSMGEKNKMNEHPFGESKDRIWPVVLLNPHLIDT